MTEPRLVHDPGSVLLDGDTVVAVGPVEALDADQAAAEELFERRAKVLAEASAP
jgi:hypothetical protein